MRRLSTQDLVELLKMPTCFGEARKVVLKHLGNRYGRTFANHWEFVRFAKEQQLDLDLDLAAQTMASPVTEALQEDCPMPGPLDDTLKHLTELSPQDWVVQGGWPMAPAAAIDADIATITGATDKVIRVGGSPDWLLAVDFHSGHDAGQLLPRMLLYNAALGKRHGLRVRSLAVVLHPGADSPQLSGVYERGFPGEPADILLRYRVLRVWEVPAARWLSGGLGVLPLAPLGAVQEAELPAVIAQMKERLDREVPHRQAAELWSATYILMGARYEEALIESLLQGVITMEESVTYQAILRKGKAEGKAEGLAEGKAEGKAEGQAKEARKILLLLGRNRFGEPTPEAVAALNSLADVEKLEQLNVRLLQVSSWQELLG